MNSLKGHLLIASPSLDAPFFTKTVILMLDHSEEGALGVVLNRPTEATITDIAEQVIDEPMDWEKPIYLGGPVQGPLMVLHAEEDDDEDDEEVMPGIFRSIEANRVRDLIRNQTEPSRVVANYSGWGPGQLEGEFDWNSWLTLPATAEHVFWDRETDLWEEVVKAVKRGRSPISSG